MNKITQEQIRKVLNCKSSTVSRYLTGKREIKLISALKVRDSLNVPIEIFVDDEEQFKYFGKRFITKENISNIKDDNQLQKEEIK